MCTSDVIIKNETLFAKKMMQTSDVMTATDKTLFKKKKRLPIGCGNMCTNSKFVNTHIES